MSGWIRPVPLPLKEAQERCLCRLCHRRDADPSPFGSPLPFRLDFGEEFAHERCLDKWPTPAWLGRKRLIRFGAIRMTLQARASASYRDPLKVRALHARDDRVRRLMERIERRLDALYPHRHRFRAGD